MSITMHRVERMVYDLSPVAVCDQCGKEEALPVVETVSRAGVPDYGETYPMGWVRAAEISDLLNQSAGAYCSWACLATFASSRAPVPA